MQGLENIWSFQDFPTCALEECHLQDVTFRGQLCQLLGGIQLLLLQFCYEWRPDWNLSYKQGMYPFKLMDLIAEWLNGSGQLNKCYSHEIIQDLILQSTYTLNIQVR